MKILSIETSCDETAICLVEAIGGLKSPVFKVLGNGLFSQIEIHKEYGGVYPMLAKREHAKNLPPILKKVLTESGFYTQSGKKYSKEIWDEVKEITKREESLYEGLLEILDGVSKPEIDVISVTSGPGLAPALWVGISFAEALSKLWNIPVVGTNHMEGHIASILIENSDERPVVFPALALLISGGHTELVAIQTWGNYKIIGQTRDDAVGEAFDKTARLLNLPYPGGPEISKLAEIARVNSIPHTANFPRPMIHSKDFDFSFSGLKTAVLYYIKNNFPDGNVSEENKMDISREFEDSVIEVLLNKTERARHDASAKTLIIAGGVIANKKIREVFSTLEQKYNDLIVKVPTRTLSTDNALMIATATYINITLNPDLLSDTNTLTKKIIADGNLRLGVVK